MLCKTVVSPNSPCKLQTDMDVDECRSADQADQAMIASYPAGVSNWTICAFARQLLLTESHMFSRSAQPTSHLLLGNVGPGVGVRRDAIAAALAPLGCINVHVPQLDDKEACYVFATFASQSAAAHARELLHEKPCADLGGRVLTAKFAAQKSKGRVTIGEVRSRRYKRLVRRVTDAGTLQKLTDDMPAFAQASDQEHVHVCRTSEECGVPGLTLIPNFVSEAEEQARL